MKDELDGVVRYGTGKQAKASNILLKPGQFGYEFDTGILKIGDGIKKYNDLKPLPFSLINQNTIDLWKNVYNLYIQLINNPITESDPLFNASPAASITNVKISDWDNAYNWGNHALQGYLTSVDLTGYATQIWVLSQGFLSNLVALDITTALGYTPENTSNKGNANGYVPLNGSTKIDLTYFPDELLGNVKYKGTYNNASNIVTSADPIYNNLPLPVSSASTEGIYFICTDSFTLGLITYNVGDWIISNGTAGWDKVDNTDSVFSFNSRLGNIVLLSSDVISALGYTPYNGILNPLSFLTGITSGNVISALGYTPEDVANKQNNLTPSSTKYPTVNAVVTGLSTKADSVHSHVVADITDITTVLNTKQDKLNPVIKSSDTATTSTTMIDVSDMTITVDINTNYIFEFSGRIGSSAIYGGRLKLTYPSGSVIEWQVLGNLGSVGTSINFKGYNNSSESPSYVTGNASGQDDGVFIIKGSIKVGSTAGTVQLQCRSMNNTNTFTVYAGSTVQYIKL